VPFLLKVDQYYFHYSNFTIEKLLSHEALVMGRVIAISKTCMNNQMQFCKEQQMKKIVQGSKFFARGISCFKSFSLTEYVQGDQQRCVPIFCL